MSDDERQIVDSRALKSMTPDQVVEAHKAGRLDALQRGADLRKYRKLSPDQRVQVVENMTVDEIDAAERAGLFGSPSTGADLGARGERVPSGATRGDLKRMSPSEIVAARREGRLDAVMRGEA
jgi:hypothetical protein